MRVAYSPDFVASFLLTNGMASRSLVMTLSTFQVAKTDQVLSDVIRSNAVRR